MTDAILMSGTATNLSGADAPLTLGERVQARAAFALARLPGRLLRLLSGEPPVVVDGQTLDPGLQFIRAMRRRQGAPGYCEPTIPIARARLRREAKIFTGRLTRVGAVSDLAIPGEAGALPVRHYAPEGAGDTPQPLLVYYHGGGFAVCDLDTHDEACRLLCHHANVHVLSVDYRLAPEHPFPAGLHDAQAALRWALANAAVLGADPARVAVGGDSGGGNLATVVARLAAHGELPDVPAGARPVARLLIYPATDAATPRASYALFGDGFFLDRKDVKAFAGYYVRGVEVQATDPLVSPLHAARLDHMPQALVVTAGFDVLRDEGAAYAEALRDAGNVVGVHHFPALGHAFINLTGVNRASHRAVVEVAKHFRLMLDTLP